MGWVTAVILIGNVCTIIFFLVMLMRQHSRMTAERVAFNQALREGRVPGRQHIVTALGKLNLVQEKPRVRTIMLSGGDTIRVKFPYVSSGTHRNRLFVFFHTEPWATLDEAVGLLHVGYNTHQDLSGAVCLGGVNPNRFKPPGQAFWHTEFNGVVAETDFRGRPNWLSFVNAINGTIGIGTAR